MNVRCLLGALAALAMSIPVTALAQTPASASAAQAQAATAHAHALMAQGANSVTMAHTHLHHVINCLEGPQGKDFDAAAGNPCKGKGHGALADGKGNPSREQAWRRALDSAQAGLQADQLKQVQQDAAKAASLLQAPSAP